MPTEAGDDMKNSERENRDLCLNYFSLVFCGISIFMDPVFFYIPVIKLDKNCMDFDKELVVISCVFRLVIDVFYIICTRYQLRTNTSTPRHLLMTSLDILAVLPLPQVVIIIIVSKTSLLNILEALMNVLKYCVFFQFVLRVIRICPLFKKATSTHIPVEVTWAKAAFNLCLYIIFGHVFGALWYHFAIERVIDCWKKACIVMNQTGCNHQSFNCHKSSGNYIFLNYVCSPKSHNKDFYDFGIYLDALQSGIVERRYLKKFMYCFRWGLQSLSGLAQNLEPSTDILENIFTTSIIISSVVLLVFLLGKMQAYLLGESIRLEEMKHQLREGEKWKIFKQLPEDLRQQIHNHKQNLWQATKGVDGENFFNTLPKNLRKKIKCELGLNLLKKVPNFRSLPDKQLEALCEQFKIVQYAAGTKIVDEGDRIEEMIIIWDGKFFTNENNAQVEFCGEELYSWAHQSCNQLPNSDRTVTAHSNILAFSFEANDIKDVVRQRPNHSCGEELYSWAHLSCNQLPNSDRTVTAHSNIVAFSFEANDIKDVVRQRPNHSLRRSLSDSGLITRCGGVLVFDGSYRTV